MDNGRPDLIDLTDILQNSESEAMDLVFFFLFVFFLKKKNYQSVSPPTTKRKKKFAYSVYDHTSEYALKDLDK